MLHCSILSVKRGIPRSYEWVRAYITSSSRVLTTAMSFVLQIEQGHADASKSIPAEEIKSRRSECFLLTVTAAIVFVHTTLSLNSQRSQCYNMPENKQKRYYHHDQMLNILLVSSVDKYSCLILYSCVSWNKCAFFFFENSLQHPDRWNEWKYQILKKIRIKSEFKSKSFNEVNC